MYRASMADARPNRILTLQRGSRDSRVAYMGLPNAMSNADYILYKLCIELTSRLRAERGAACRDQLTVSTILDGGDKEGPWIIPPV